MGKIFESLKQNKWSQYDINQRLLATIIQKFDISEICAKILISKNINIEEILDFLDPKLKNLLPNPYSLLDMEVAVNHIVNAIKSNKKIVAYADYDVDGATSSAILKRFLAMIGKNIEIYIPDRIKEGYGPNIESFIKLKEQNVDLVITLDCGTVAFEPIKKANEIGLDIIVVDHHLSLVDKPKAVAVINPNRVDEKFPYKNLCAAAVCFLFVVAINKRLKEIDFYKQNQINEPNILSLLDLVALGTVCDVMSLIGLNRAFVKQGLKIIKNRSNLGIRAISDCAKLNAEPSVYHLGFFFGPRINSAGRIGQSNLGATLLSTDCEIRASEIANKLEELNCQRKDIESDATKEACNYIEANKEKFKSKEIIILSSRKWHQGVIGIIAARIKELYEKPVVIISLNNNIGKASARSIADIDIGKLIIEAKLNDFIIEGGGHAMAGGFSIEEHKIEQLDNFFETYIKTIKKIGKKVNFFVEEIDIEQISDKFLDEIDKLEPYGVGNEQPVFIFRNLVRLKVNLMGKNNDHLNCLFASKNSINSKKLISGVLFNIHKSIISDYLLDDNINKYDFKIAGKILVNNWGGIKRLQIQIEDIIL